MSTEKKIVDYLHLYGLDCPIMTPDGEGIVLVIYPKVVEVSLKIIKYQQVMKGRKGGGEMHYKYNYEDCQLLFYRLEDMTPEDLQECGNMVYDFSDDSELNNHKPEDFQVCAPEQFRFLIKKGYWLFGNDWFDEGYIIDKKTLKQ